MQTWELWYPDAGATGLPFARARIEPAEAVWVHAAPETLAVIVRDDEERVLARGERLARAAERLPMTCLRRVGTRLVREDRWPDERDVGAIVLLAGGEAGRLVEWWNAGDGSEWRWRIEFSNRR